MSARVAKVADRCGDVGEAYSIAAESGNARPLARSGRMRGVSPMTLAPGSRLGPYEVLSPLGAGGMGEAYKARDTTPEVERCRLKLDC